MSKINLAKSKLFNLIFVKTKAFLIIIFCIFFFLSLLISFNQKSKNTEQLMTRCETAIISSIRDCEIRYQSLQNTISRLRYYDFPTKINDWRGNMQFISNSFEEVEYIAWVDNNFLIKEIFPILGNESKLNKTASNFIIDSNSITQWNSVTDNNYFQGFILSSINVSKLINNCEKSLLEEFMIEVVKNGVIIYRSSN